MSISNNSMMCPDHPGPVAKDVRKKPLGPWPFFDASWANPIQWAIACTQVKNTIDHATSLWQEIYILSRGQHCLHARQLLIETSRGLHEEQIL